jgi:hypothetical protein
MKTASAVIVIVIVYAFCLAQSSTNRQKKQFACGTIITNFDKSKNETRVQLMPLILEGVFHVAPGETLRAESSSIYDGVALTVFYAYPGQMVTKPVSIVLVIESESMNPTYDRERNASATIDGYRIPFGLMERAAWRTNLGYLREDLSISISLDAFTKIINAKKAKITIGANNFTLNDCDLDALRRFAAPI